MMQKPIFVPFSPFSSPLFQPYSVLRASSSPPISLSQLQRFSKPGLPGSFSLSLSSPCNTCADPAPGYRHTPPFVLAAPDAARPVREMLSNTFMLIGPPIFKGRIKLNAHVGSLAAASLP
jgi:hypothetical protein